jgi:hypothetical protein
MRRFHLGVAAIALPVLAFSLFLAGCSKEEKKADNSSSSSTSTQDPTKTAGPVTVLESKGGVLKGKITLKGSPDVAGLTKALQEKIEAKKDDKDYCMKGSESEKTAQEYRLGENKQLGNVFVWIKPETGTFFKVSDKQLSELKNSKVKIRQPHCAFIPHSAFLFSQYHADPAKPTAGLKATGQVLEVVNDAEISHNTNWTGGARNKGDNVMLAKGKDRLVDNLVPEPGAVTIKCNIHPWMDANLWVVDTPYYAISYSDTLDGKDKVKKDDAKFGTYEIKNLPSGVKVRVLAWHEKAGWLNKGEGKGEVIEIAEGKETTKDFEAEAK